jgi:hypothetical protein
MTPEKLMELQGLSADLSRAQPVNPLVEKLRVFVDKLSTQPVDKLSTRRHSVDKPVDKPVERQKAARKAAQREWAKQKRARLKAARP